MPERFDDQINAFWNELVTTGDANPGALDPRMADAIEQINARSLSPISDSARERIRRKVLDQSVSTEGADLVNLTAAALPLPSPNGHTAPGQRRPARAAPATLSRSRMRWALIAAAVLLIVGGIGSYFVASPGNRLFGGGNHPEPNPIPAATTESGWPQFRGGAARTGYSSDPGPGGDLDLRWSFTTDEVVNSVVSADGVVFAYGRKGDLYAIDAVTGTQKWAVDLSPNEYSEDNRYPSPAVADGVLYIATFDGGMVALDARTGAVRWQQPVSSKPITSSPAVADGVLYQLTPEGSMLALDPATGEKIWQSDGTIAFQDLAPTIGDGLLFIGDLDGDLVAIDAATGEAAWASAPLLVHRVAAYRDGTVYVSCGDGSFKALDATSGEVRWTTEPQAGQALNPLVTPNAFIATNQEGLLQALDLATGKQIWSVPGPGNSSSPHASDSAVYAVSADLSAFVAYDLATGAELGRVAVDQAGSTAAISGDTLVLSSIADQGVVRSFGPGGGTPKEATAGPATAIEPATPVAAETDASPVSENTFDASQVAFAWEVSDPIQYPGVAVGPDGNVYVPDPETNAIFIFSPGGELIDQWGEPGSGPGQFNSPGSIGWDADGNSYVFDSLNNRVQKFSPDHTFLLEWGSEGTGNGQFSEVQGTVDPINGLVYTVEFENNRVQVFDLDGNFLDKWGSSGTGNGQFVHPGAVAVGPDGLIYVGDAVNGSGGRVQIFDRFGTWQGTLLDASGQPTTFSEVWGIAFDAAGNIYVSDYWRGAIRVFDPDRGEIGSIADIEGAGPFEEPSRIAIDPDGGLYVADGANGRLVKLQLPQADA